MKQPRASKPKTRPISSGTSASQDPTQNNDDSRLVASFETDLDRFDYSYTDNTADIQEITGGHYADYS